ncbi:unnamed protein product, partial [Acanthocheilonema viteae]
DGAATADNGISVNAWVKAGAKSRCVSPPASKMSVLKTDEVSCDDDC